MANLTYKKTARYLGRCADARRASSHPGVVRTYDEVLEPNANTYLASHSAVGEAQTSVDKARILVKKALRAFDQEFRTVRAVVATRVAPADLPGTLKEEGTDTDKKNSVQKLLAIVTAHRGEAWADELLAGPFGTQAPDLVEKLDALADAGGALYEAEVARRSAFEVVYPLYLSFKDVVRQAEGTASPAYQRINARGRSVVEPEPTPEPPQPAPSPVVAPTNGASTGPAPMLAASGTKQ